MALDTNRIANLRVLVIDDDEDMVGVLEVVLRAIGVRYITSFTDPSEVKQWLLTGKGDVDLIVCDLMMPKVDGLQLLTDARAALPAVKFVMLTANASEIAVRLAVRGRVDAYLAKPITAGALKERLLEVIAAPSRGTAGQPAAEAPDPPPETPEKTE